MSGYAVKGFAIATSLLGAAGAALQIYQVAGNSAQYRQGSISFGQYQVQQIYSVEHLIGAGFTFFAGAIMYYLENRVQNRERAMQTNVSFSQMDIHNV